MTLTQEILAKLKRPFDEKTISVKVQSVSKDRTKAMLVCYVQHTDVYARLEEVDPGWSCEVVRTENGQLYTVSMRLTVCGVTRENAGIGEDAKGAYSDAIKRCAMLFGVGRYLYDSETVWVPYNEQSDRFKSFSIQDYQAAIRPGQDRLPTGGAAGKSPVAPKTAAVGAAPKTIGSVKAPMRSRILMVSEIGKAQAALNISLPDLEQWGHDYIGKASKDMTLEELERFLNMLQEEVGRSGVAV